MSIAVEKTEYGHDHNRQPHRCAIGKQDCRAKDEHRQRDSDFDRRQGKPGHCRNAAKGHHHGERRWQQIDQRSAQEGAPYPHGDHRQKMIGSGKWMQEPAHKPKHKRFGFMGHGGGVPGQQRCSKRDR